MSFLVCDLRGEEFAFGVDVDCHGGKVKDGDLCVAKGDSFEHISTCLSVSLLVHALTTRGYRFAISGRVWTKNPRIGTGRRF